MKRLPALLFLVLSAVFSTPTAAQESDEVPASLAGPALFSVGDCVAFFVSDAGLALTTRTCLTSTLTEGLMPQPGATLEVPIGSPFLNNIDGLSLRLVAAPPVEAAEFGPGTTFPSHRLDFAFIRVEREGSGLKTERFLPIAPASGIEVTANVRILDFEPSADSADVRSWAALPRGFEHDGRVVPASTSLFDLMDLHHGAQGQAKLSLPADWGQLVPGHLPAKLNLALETEAPARPGSPLVTEHFEVAGLVFSQTSASSPPRSLAVSISAIEATLSQWLDGSEILAELRSGTRTTKSGIE